MDQKQIKKILKPAVKRILAKFLKAGSFKLSVAMIAFEAVWHVLIKPFIKAKNAEIRLKQKIKEKTGKFAEAKDGLNKDNFEEKMGELWAK